MPIVTPFMSLTLPDVGAGGTVGTTWATYLNTALSAIDSHDHTSGSGNQIPSAGLDIDADLDFSDFGADNLGFVAFTARALKPTPTLSLYAKGADLYFQDSTGTEVRITQDSALAGSSDGGFGGDYGDGDELATYSNATKTFSFMQDTSPAVPAKIYSSDISIGQATTAPNVITLKSPNSLAASYTLTLPAALPASTTQRLLISTSGVASYETPESKSWVHFRQASNDTMSTSYATLTIPAVDSYSGTTIGVSGNNLTFPFIGKWEARIVLSRLQPSSGTASIKGRLKIRNTTAGSDLAKSATFLAQYGTAPNLNQTVVVIIPFTVASVSDNHQLMGVADAVALNITADDLGDGTPIAWDAIFEYKGT